MSVTKYALKIFVRATHTHICRKLNINSSESEYVFANDFANDFAVFEALFSFRL